MSRPSLRSILFAAVLILTAGLAFVAGAGTAGPGEKTLAEVKDFTDRFNKVYETNDAAVAAYRIYTKMRQTDRTVVASWHQETDVLFKRNGRWQVVHLHDSPAPDDAQKK